MLFRIYISSLDLSAYSPGKLEAAMAGHILAQAELAGLCQRRRLKIKNRLQNFGADFLWPIS